MKARIALTIIALTLYVGLFNLYIYDLHLIDIKHSKLFYNYLTLSAVLFFLIDLKSGFVNAFHRQFNLLLILCVIINYILIICIHQEILKGVYPMFYGFNISVFAVTLAIFICGIKYKTFKY